MKIIFEKIKSFKPQSSSFILGLVLGVVLAGLIGLGFWSSEFLAPSEKGQLAQVGAPVKESPIIGEDTDLGEAEAYLRFKAIKESFIPTGIPDVYGKELNISFDQVQDAINKVALFDPTYGNQKIELAGANLERYINIGFRIACEYCCGAKSLVFENGEAACGCEHSQMMRGLAAYLIKNHPEVSDDWILEELTKWKRTHFPKQMLSAKLVELEKAGESGIKEILEEFPEFLPEMVGGC